MLTLILMRHAKSSWDNFDQPDHDRPLNGRGAKSAKAMGRWLSEEGMRPDQALVSSAARTQETFQRLRFDCPATSLKNLYLAPATGMLDTLRRATGQTVLLLGHNPGSAQFARQIVSAAPDHPDFARYPTCATLVATFAIAEWSALTWGLGQVRAFDVPRAVIAAHTQKGAP